MCTLMLYGEHHGNFSQEFQYVLAKAKGLHALFLFGGTYNMEYLLPKLYIMHITSLCPYWSNI